MMNERIEQLADQCMTERQDSNGVYVEYFDHKKFAELIIEECAFQCQHLGDMERIGKHFKVDVFKQFGV